MNECPRSRPHEDILWRSSSWGLRVFVFSWLHFRRYGGFITIHLVADGWEGWDEYAPFYDWENARTLGRKDVPFWRDVAANTKGRVLELGCGTGRISLPLARAGVSLVGVDRSAPMLARARPRVVRLGRKRSARAARTSRSANPCVTIGVAASRVANRSTVNAVVSRPRNTAST